MTESWHAWAGMAAAAVSLVGYPIYALEFLGPGKGGFRSWMFSRLALRGGTAPRLLSWGIWAAVQGVIFAGARAEGATDTNYLPLAYFWGCLGVTALALRYGDRRLTALDGACGGLALVSLVLLVGTRDSFAALVLAIVADSLASLPTLVSVARNPHHESLAGWVCFLAGGLLNFLAFPDLDPRTWTFEVAGYTLIVVAQQAFVVGRILAAR